MNYIVIAKNARCFNEDGDSVVVPAISLGTFSAKDGESAVAAAMDTDAARGIIADGFDVYAVDRKACAVNTKSFLGYIQHKDGNIVIPADKLFEYEAEGLFEWATCGILIDFADYEESASAVYAEFVRLRKDTHSTFKFKYINATEAQINELESLNVGEEA